MNDKPPCKICSGQPDEHEGRQHAYTTQEGQLLTHQQKAKQEQTQSSNGSPMVVRLPGAQTNEAGAIGRLMELLIDKGMFSLEEAIYVAGMGSKPDQKSGFADPAPLFRSGGSQ